MGWHNWPRTYSSLREEASEYETAAYHDDDGGGNDGDTFADEVMRCGDERTLWAAVLDRGRPLRQQEFKAISSQMSYLGRNEMACGDSDAANAAVALLLDHVESSIDDLDATDVEDALEAFNDFPGAVIPRELGSRLVRAYSAMEPRDGNKNIRRLLVASRKSLASRDARIFEDLLDQLVDRRLGHKSRRDLANALWSLRVDGLDRRVRRRAVARAVERFAEACESFPPAGGEDGALNACRQYSQVIAALPRMGRSGGAQVAARLLRSMLRDTEGFDVHPSHWVVVVDAVHKLNAAGKHAEPLGAPLEEVVRRFLASDDLAEAKQVAVFLCASRYLDLIQGEGKRDRIVRDLLGVFHGKLAHAAPKETGNVLGSLARMRVSPSGEVLKDVLSSFLGSLAEAQKRQISQCLVGAAKLGLDLSGEETNAIMDRYWEEESSVNTWHVGGLMWALSRLDRRRNVGARIADGIPRLLEEFVGCMRTSGGEVNPIHVSQALQGATVLQARSQGDRERVAQNVKALVMTLAGNPGCNSQVLANSLASLRKLRGGLGNIFDEETTKEISSLFGRLARSQTPKINELAQAISAVSELGLSIDPAVLELALEKALKGFYGSTEANKAEFGCPSLSKIIFSASKMEGIRAVSQDLRVAVVHAYEALPVEVQQRARGTKHARDDRFRILNHSRAFLKAEVVAA